MNVSRNLNRCFFVVLIISFLMVKSYAQKPFDRGYNLRFMQFAQVDSSISFIGIDDSIMYGNINPKTGNLDWVKSYNLPVAKKLNWNVKVSNALPDKSLVHSMEDRFNGLKTYFSRVNNNGVIINSLSISPTVKVEKLWADTNGIINVLGGDTLDCGYYIRLDSSLNVLNKLKFDSIKLCDIVYNNSDVLLMGSHTSKEFAHALAVIKLDSGLNVKDHRFYATCGGNFGEFYYSNSNDGVKIGSIKQDTTELTIFYSSKYDDAVYSSMWVRINLSNLQPIASQCWATTGVLNVKELSDTMSAIVGGKCSLSMQFTEAPFVQIFKNKLPFLSDTGFTLKPNYNVKYFHDVFKTDSGYILAGLGWPYSESLVYGTTSQMETTCNKTPFNFYTTFASPFDTLLVVNSSTMSIQSDTNVISSFSSWFSYGRICSGVSVEEHETSKFQLYPNPSQNQLTITANDLSGPYQLQMLNMLGDAVLTKNGTFNGSIHIQHALPAGVYLVQLKVGEEMYSRKLIVERD